MVQIRAPHLRATQWSKQGGFLLVWLDPQMGFYSQESNEMHISFSYCRCITKLWLKFLRWLKNILFCLQFCGPEIWAGYNTACFCSTMLGTNLVATQKLADGGIFTYMSGGWFGCWLEQEGSHMASSHGQRFLAWSPQHSWNSYMPVQGSEGECPREPDRSYILCILLAYLRSIQSPFHCIQLVTNKSQAHPDFGERTKTPLLGRRPVKVTLQKSMWMGDIVAAIFKKYNML